MNHSIQLLSFSSLRKYSLLKLNRFHLYQWNFLVFHIDCIFTLFHSQHIRILLWKQLFSCPPSFLFTCILSFPHSLKFHYFFIYFPDPQMPFRLCNMEQNGMERNEQFLIFKASAFSLCHMEIFWSTVCQQGGAPFLHCSLPSIVLGTHWCWIDGICLAC